MELGDRQQEGAACNNLAVSYRSLKEYDKAIELFEHSLVIQEELGNRPGQACACFNIYIYILLECRRCRRCPVRA